MKLPQLYDIFRERWERFQTAHIISDTHFGDKDLQANIKDRPNDEDYVKLINSKVGKNDLLICLGDVGDIECARRLKGYKILIAGNHDAGMSNYKDIFDEVYAGALIVGEKLILSHEPVDIVGMFNLHGHIHAITHKNDNTHFNCCSDYIGYTPINFNQWMKQGYLSKLQTLHRKTINKAALNKHGQKRLKKKE